MTAEEWMEYVPALKKAAAQAGAGHALSCCACVFGSVIIFWNLCSRDLLLIKVLASRGRGCGLIMKDSSRLTMNTTSMA